MTIDLYMALAFVAGLATREIIGKVYREGVERGIKYSRDAQAKLDAVKGAQ